MAYTPKNPNWQATMANSSPVVIASDQASIPVTATNLDVQSWGADLATSTQAAAIETAVEAIQAAQLPDGHNVTVDNATIAVTQSWTWDEVGINDSGNSITVDNPQLSVVGSWTEAAALRVTIATDSTGVLSIDDNGGAITVDGSVTVSATNLDIRDIDAATDDITIHWDVWVVDQLDLTNTNPLAVAIVDWDGTQITSFGGWTEYTSDAASPAAPVGATTLIVRDDALSTQETTDDDWTVMRGNARGALWVELDPTNNITANIGTSGSLNLEATQTAMSAKLPATLGQKAMAASMAVVLASDQASVPVAATLTAETTKVIGTVRVASGWIASGAIASGAIASWAIAAWAIAAGATSIATTEDTASAAADHLVKVAQIRLDTPVSGANLTASGDYTQFIADSFGKTWTAWTYAEDLAHVAGEPIKGNGARRIDTPATSAGTSWDWATVDASAEGALWVTTTPTTTGGCTIFRSIDLDETEEEIKATAGNLYGYYFYNASASVRYLKFYNATAASVSVGTTTPVLTFPLPPSSAGHLTFPFPIGFATAITAAVTTGLADADTGAPAANDVILNVFYK